MHRPRADIMRHLDTWPADNSAVLSAAFSAVLSTVLDARRRSPRR